MTRQELDDIFALQTVAIIAAAGHGKTEMIVDMVEYGEGKQLLLTHTHAGVDTLQRRLDRRSIPKTKYTISTIAAFCIRWGLAYYNTARIDLSLSPYTAAANDYYVQFYTGAKYVFLQDWSKRVVKETYTGIIVDEYQDCLQDHHEMFQVLSHHLPVRVFGDPLQGIFSFSGQKIVDWNNLGFPIVEVRTKPWRWQKVNPMLGQYLENLRAYLLPALNNQTCNLNLGNCKGSIEIKDPKKFNVNVIKEFKQFDSVLYIAKWEYQQKTFATKMSGIFQIDESQECDDLFNYAEAFTNQHGADLFLSVIEFEHKCATGVNKRLSSYINRLNKQSFDFSRIDNFKEFGLLLNAIKDSNKIDAILKILAWFERNKTFHCYRKELHAEMIRSIQYAADHEVSILDGARRLRRDPTLQKRYQGFKCLSSRTLLSKGLEFDCVIIDMSKPLTAKEFYVAMTRAMKKIYILSSTSRISLSPN